MTQARSEKSTETQQAAEVWSYQTTLAGKQGRLIQQLQGTQRKT